MHFGSTLYVQVSRGELRAEVVPDGPSTTVVCQGLAHPRTLMGEFMAIQGAFKEALQALDQKAWYKPAPVVLIHLLPKVEGGYTDVELRAFREAAMGAGASQSYLLVDRQPLTSIEKADISAFLKR